MALSTRQPFAELGTPRLHALQSAKNRQNAITPASAFSSPLKPTLTPSTGKRQRTTSVFEDYDSENVDPSIFNSPTKKSKTTDGYSKPSKFSLVSPSSRPSPALAASPSIPFVRKALSSPNTTDSTPISHSRGSPKHKRVGLLSKRRVSSSPFRRVDPPSFTQSSPALPFSIDAALSGTIPNYTPKSTSIATPTVTPITTPIATPSQASPALEDSMPKGWFFEIHEDSAEQEASNMMEHSAAVMDISSDDDFETKRRNEEEERGKENVPPPDFLLAQSRAQRQSTDAMEAGEQAVEQHVKLPRLRMIAQDAMDEDRKPLGDLPAVEFYADGCDAGTFVTVDAGLEKPSGLSKEFDFNCQTPEKKQAEVIVAPEQAEPAEVECVQVYADENAAPQEEATAAATPALELLATASEAP